MSMAAQRRSFGDGFAPGATAQLVGGSQAEGEEARLLLSARLLEDVLAQDDLQVRLDEVCQPNTGSSHYDRRGTGNFEVLHAASALPGPLLPPSITADADSSVVSRGGVLPEIERMWRSHGSQVALWRYSNPQAPDVMTYQGVTQNIVAVATARPKSFVSGVAYFLVISTPVDVSLHVIRFEEGSNRMLPLLRTQHVVATDDIAVCCIATDDSTGRIFLGSTDGSVFEFMYYDSEDLNWVGQPKKCRRGAVNRSFVSHLPGFLRRASRAVFGAPESVVQLTVDGNRGLLFCLTNASSVIVYQIPASRRDAQGSLEEPALVQICSIPMTQLANAAASVRSQLFPGLAPPRVQSFGASLLSGSASSMQLGGPPKLRIVKIVPFDRNQGGDVVLCAVAEDGTRFFLRGVFRQSRGPGAGASGAPGIGGPGASGSGTGAATWGDNRGPGMGPSSGMDSAGNATASTSSPSMTGLQVHHVRFLESSAQPFTVKDALQHEGITLLLGQQGSSTLQGPIDVPALGDLTRAAPPASGGDVLVAISSDLRTLAQRQSQGRSPWLSPPQGLAETVEVVQLESCSSLVGSSGYSHACQAFSLAPFSCQLPRPLHFMYSRSGGTACPVLQLSELAKQQLVPPTRFLVASNLGAHVLTKRRPLDNLRQLLSAGDLQPLKEFAMDFTAEQTCALCFQLLGSALPSQVPISGVPQNAGSLLALTAPSGEPPLALPSMPPASQGLLGSTMLALGDAPGAGGNGTFNVGGLSDLLALRASPRDIGGSQLACWQPAGQSALQLAQRSGSEEQLLLRAEHLLLHPQLATQMGFLQAWQSMEAARAPPAWNTALGHSIHTRSAQRLSGRLRGLCLYVSRIVRPMWLVPFMDVDWPARASAKPKRKFGEWWPPTPEPAPTVQGSCWRCAWSRAQRGYMRDKLAQLLRLLQLCRPYLADTTSKADVVSFGSASFHGAAAAGQQEASEAGLFDGLVLLVSRTLEVLAFLELVAARVELLSGSQLEPTTLVRFAELSFRDLVCQSEARAVLQQLLLGGVVECHQLHARCPRLFSAADLQLQEAVETLASVQQSLQAHRQSAGGRPGAENVATIDHVHLSHLVQRALRAFERHAAKVDIEDVARRLRSVGAFRGLIGLCVRVARARDPRDESVQTMDATSARLQQLHYARLECYQVVLELFEELLAGLQQQQAIAQNSSVLLGVQAFTAGSAAGRTLELPELLPIPVPPSEAGVVLDAFLRHCLESRLYLSDELFHFCILKWMLQHNLPLYSYDSPFLANFLETHASDQPELLCRHYQHCGRWREACDAYLALAQGGRRVSRSSGAHLEPADEKPSIDEQIVLLQSAALCAQMPGSGRRAEPIQQAMMQLGQVKRQQQEEELRGCLPQDNTLAGHRADSFSGRVTRGRSFGGVSSTGDNLSQDGSGRLSFGGIADSRPVRRRSFLSGPSGGQGS
eukprot:TRINITY_DN36115_c0_g2_i1.p1 TRINITY_DN36115_c0_g2~~TRINITY_DN36115_c0_g2_i1.p1  ORF type:complete len:1449 (+),score=227.16 TRINITY_DN36115_c0_g2_i1:100-4446(+)